MSDSRRNYRSGMVSDDLVKRLWKGIADTEQQQDAADRIEELEKRINDLAADKINLRSENMELKAKLAKTKVIK